jgi:hypothetical protein
MKEAYTPRPMVPRPKRGKRPVEWKPASTKFRVITLRVAHRRNGQTYGPGEIRVKDALARDLQHADEQVGENEQRFLHPTEAMIGIRYSYTGAAVPFVRPVRSLQEAFNDTWTGHMEPAFHLRPDR